MSADPLTMRELFATPMVHAYDVRCTANRTGCGEEEGTSVPTLVFPRRGVFRWHVGKRSIVADPNTALLLHPARPFRIGHPGWDGDDCTSLRIDHEVVESALGDRAETLRLWTLPNTARRTLHESLCKLDDAVDGLEGEETTMTVLGLLAAAPPRTLVRDEAAIEAVRERIAVDPSEHATLGALAREVGVSPYHLARRFRMQIGSSIHEYRTRLRLQIALDRLRDGADAIAPLALDLGFASHAHFATAFRRTFGFSPREARRSL